MESPRAHAILWVAMLLATGSQTSAQRTPHVGYVYPAGARQGTTIRARMAGQYLDGAASLAVSGEGIKARVIEHIKPLNGKEINLLRDRLAELQAMLKPPTDLPPQERTADPNGSPPSPPAVDRAAAQLEIAQIRAKLANPKNRSQENRQLSEDVVLEITVTPDATLGCRELRLVTNLGLSNPVIFHIGELPEVTEKEPNDGLADADLSAAVPLVLNGQIMPGDVDRFRLELKKGMKLVITAAARRLMPYLADAVPGWFQATLTLYDPDGREAAYADDHRFDPDPVLYYEVPQDGAYVLEIKDAIFRGREDFVYRITAGQLPCITGIFPLGGPAGATTTVRLTGWNLPSETITAGPYGRAPDIVPLSFDKHPSDSPLFAVDVLPECLEKEPNNQQTRAQQVSLPMVVNGHIDGRDDCDVFVFQARAGDTIVAEVLARRLGSPLDAILKLTDAGGKVLLVNDDHEDKAAGLVTHHADSRLSTTLPADGTYHVYLADAQHKGGPAWAYRLRLGPPRPDFALRAVPSSVNVRPGTGAPLTVHVLRRDGFAGEITLTLKDAPRGFSISPMRIPSDKDEVRLMLRAPRMADRAPMTLHLEGHTEIEGRKVIRPVVPAEDMMQAFFYRHLVPVQELKVAVVGRPVAAASARRAPQPTRQADSAEKPPAAPPAPPKTAQQTPPSK